MRPPLHAGGRLVVCLTLAHLLFAYVTFDVTVHVCHSAPRGKDGCAAAPFREPERSGTMAAGARRRSALGRGGRPVPQSETRDRILALIRERAAIPGAEGGGVRQVDVARTVGVSPITVRYHLGRLLEMGLIFELRSGSHPWAHGLGLFVPVGSDEDAMRRRALLGHGSHQRVLDLYRMEPAISLREAARRLGMTPRASTRSRRGWWGRSSFRGPGSAARRPVGSRSLPASRRGTSSARR